MHEFAALMSDEYPLLHLTIRNASVLVANAFRRVGLTGCDYIRD